MPVSLPFLSSAATATRLPETGLQLACSDPVALVPRTAGVLPAAVKAMQEIPELEVVRAKEKVRFLQDVTLAAAAMRVTEEAAVALVKARDGQGYPLLGGDDQLTYPNFRKWKSDLKKAGNGRLDYTKWTALIRDYSRGDRGRKGDEAWWTLFMGIVNNPGENSLKMDYEDACRAWRRAGMRGGEPDLQHVKYWMKRYSDRFVWLQKRKGETWFRNNVCGYIARDWDNVRVGEIWVGDHRKTDCFIRVWNEETQQWEPKRIWITAWRDAKSGHFVGWLLYPGNETPNMVAIVQCLWLAIMDNGGVPPACLYIDNGKDFVAQGFIDPVMVCGQETSIAMKLGIEVIHAIKYNARAKLIENSFKTLIPYYDQKMPGYCGSDRGSKFDDAWRFAKANVRNLPNLEQARELFCLAVADHEERTTTSLVQNGVPTRLLWENRQALRPALSQEELHIQALLPLGDSEFREIRRGPKGPSIQMRGGFYSSDELKEYARTHWGEKVRILLDVFAGKTMRGGRAVPLHVYCAAPDGRLIGRCEVHKLHAAWARTDEEREAVGEAQREVRRFASDSNGAFRQLTGRKSAASSFQVQAEWLDERGALPKPRPAADVLPGAESAGAIMARKEKTTPAAPVDADVRDALENVMFGRDAAADAFAEDEQSETAADDAGAAADPELKDALAELGM